MSLPAIPVIDARNAGEPAVMSALAEPARLKMVLDAGDRTYTPWGVRFADGRSRALSERLASPYAAAVRQVDGAIGRRGAYLLNHSYEWGCTAGAADDPGAGGSTLFRTLDWPFDGLGRALVVVRQGGPAGHYLSATWPGFVGVLTGLAPGRFAAAINQPPLPLPGWGRAVGWLAARRRVGRSRAMPPAHLLRLAFDTCPDFAAAAALLRATPICLPAIFTLAGPAAGEAMVIERTSDAAFHPADAAAANHWAATPGPAGRPRNRTSRDRRGAMCALMAAPPGWSLDWVRPPVLLPDTRLAVMANPRIGRMLLQGWESSGPATAVLDLR
jgi:hypothetical protein